MVRQRTLSSGNLTDTPQERDRRRKTLPGMASWGVGPETCRQCGYWAGGNRNVDGTLRKAICHKAQMLLPGLPPIPHWAACCKYFEANPNPPAVYLR